jgi:membrane protein YdbS with pleckstrin-like domain
VATRTQLREDEELVVTVTAAPFGVTGPAFVTALAIAAVVGLRFEWSFAHAHVAWFAGILVGPCVVVLAGRVWRWRSHRIVVTTQRVRTNAGATRRRSSSYEIAAVVAVHIDQGRMERLRRKGRVLLEVEGGMVALERVKRPDALGRVIEHQRQLMVRPEATPRNDVEPVHVNYDETSLATDDADVRWRNLFGPRWHR